MTKLFSVLLFLIITLMAYNSFCQETQTDFAPFLAKSLKRTSLKEDPDSSSRTKLLIPLGAQLYVFSETDIDGYIKVIDIKSNKLGYVRKSIIKKIKDLPLSQNNSFEESGESSSTNPEVVIKNKSELTISLIVGGKYFSLSPHTTSTETIDSGDLTYTASAPSVIPLSGVHYFKAGDKYNWTFSIVTSYRYR